MKIFTQEELAEQTQSRVWANRLCTPELALRVNTDTGAVSRVLWLTDDQYEGESFEEPREIPRFRIELDIAPEEAADDGLTIEERYKLRIRSQLIRVAELPLQQNERQLRVVVSSSDIYQRLSDRLQRFVGHKEAFQMLHGSYLEKIDWRLFKRNRIEEAGRWETCMYNQCKRPVADLTAVVRRQMEVQRQRRYA